MTVGHVLLAFTLLATAYVVIAWNRFAAQRQAVAATWSGVDVQLQRRHDLIPNLVEAVAGYAKHEGAVLQAVTAARSRAVQADQDPAAGPQEQAPLEASLTGSLRQLFAVAEGYPALLASQQFLALQEQLVETEDRIAAARRLYNIEVQQYNRRLEAVPSNLVGSVFGLRPATYFQAVDRTVGSPPAVTG